MLLTKLANQEIINFLRTVTIKNGYFADQLKKTLVNEQYWNTLPEERNPYYLHMCGQYILSSDVTANVSDPSTGIVYPQKYSSSFDLTNSDGLTTTRVHNIRIYTEDAFDEMMYVTSLDTQETIPFTVENLHGDAANAASAVHRKTLEAYKVPGRYFDMLCEKYPKQVDLIKSIVYLVPAKELTADEIASYNGNPPTESELRMKACLEANHLTYLTGDPTLLDQRERDCLLSSLRSFLDIVRKRWDVPEYSYEENYPSVQWAAIWSLLPLILVSQRYSNVRTPMVHSSHIWDYLTSKGLDSYRGYLSADQEWFLYKNIQFLRENSGQHRVLNILIDNLLADYNLHIESKTIVMDKTGITEETDIGQNYAEQCANCSRKASCYKNITTYKCTDFVGNKDLFKPDPVVLSENLPGSRKDRIISLLKTRYSCTDEEANYRYERSFVWRDAAIESIKLELDRDQTVDISGTIESLSDIVMRENEAGIEPVFSTDIVEEQRNDLRHVRSSYVPTKLLEITEDPVEPKYSELFTRFVTDTLMHLAPYTSNGTMINKVTESYSVTVGQDALNFILSYGEVVAMMYLGFIKENLVDLKIDVNEGTADNPSWKTNFLTNMAEYNTFDFKIPSQASLSLTFKLGKPVKQQDVVDAYTKMTDTSAIGNYVEVAAETPDPTTKYYVESGNTKVLASSNGLLSSFSSNKTYYVFKNLQSLVTNGSGQIVKIGETYYAVTRSSVTSAPIDWTDYGYTYSILGRFDRKASEYIYLENNGEIGIIPRYFKWFYDHLAVRAFRTYEELTSKIKNPSIGDFAAVWSEKKMMIYAVDSATGNAGWRTLVATDGKDIPQISFETIPGLSITAVQQVKAYSQNKVTQVNSNYIFVDEKTGEYSADIPEFTEYSAFVAWANNATATRYEKCELDQYVNVDWILENLWVDFMGTVTSQDEIGKYFEKMFTLLERLEMIRSGCGDIKTNLAINTFLEAVLFNRTYVKGTSDANIEWIDSKRNTRNFKLVAVGDNASPTYADWFSYNSEIGDNIRKIANSADNTNLWNELETKLLQALVENCDLSYAKGTTDKTKYLKLKALVKSLSSYLINFIDNDSSDRISTEISHIKEDSPSHELEFTSYVDFSPVGEKLDKIVIGDVENDMFLPATESTARPGVQYYIQNHEVEDAAEFIPASVVTGTSLRDNRYYFKVNLKTILDVNPTDHLKVWRENGEWYYDTGTDSYESSYVQTFPADTNAEKVKDADVLQSVKLMVGDKVDFKTKIYLKKINRPIIVMTGNVRQSPKLTKIMNLAAGSYHDLGYSNWNPGSLVTITTSNSATITYPSQVK